jgi:hypothetical protein
MSVVQKSSLDSLARGPAPPPAHRPAVAPRAPHENSGEATVHVLHGRVHLSAARTLGRTEKATCRSSPLPRTALRPRRLGRAAHGGENGSLEPSRVGSPLSSKLTLSMHPVAEEGRLCRLDIFRADAAALTTTPMPIRWRPASRAWDRRKGVIPDHGDASMTDGLVAAEDSVQGDEQQPGPGRSTAGRPAGQPGDAGGLHWLPKAGCWSPHSRVSSPTPSATTATARPGDDHRDGHGSKTVLTNVGPVQVG